MQKITLSLFALSLFLVPSLAAAQNYTGVLDDAGTAVYGTADNATLFGTLGTLLSVILSMLGIALLILVIYAGFLWMTAAGNDSQVKKAKDILMNAVIGMVLLIASYAIAQFVVSQLSAVGTV